jgi:hypothetical protein
MAEPKDDKKDDKPAEQPKAKSTITLKHESDQAGDLLSIGKKKYPVSEGLVEVDPEDFDTALQAGFRPA